MGKKSWNRKVDPTRDVQTRKKKSHFKRKNYKKISKRDYEDLMDEPVLDYYSDYSNMS